MEKMESQHVEPLWSCELQGLFANSSSPRTMPIHVCLEAFQFVDEQTLESSLCCDISGGDLIFHSDMYKEKRTIVEAK